MWADAFTEHLGDPFFQSEDIVIYNRDCLDSMRQLPAELVSLTVTSPPYNIGKSYEKPLPLDLYLDWCQDWIAAIHQLTTVTGSFWLNLGYLEVPGKAKAVPIPYMLWDRSDFFLLQEVVWNYGAGVSSSRMLSPRNEKFLWYVKDSSEYMFNLDAIRDPDVKYPNQKKNGKLKCNPLGKNPSDVWQIPKVTSGRDRASKERTPHPAQFPLALIDRIIRASSNEGDIVLDPFLGSGTTAISALTNGRKCIGFEVLPDYCELSARRIEAFLRQRQSAALQVSLFDGVYGE